MSTTDCIEEDLLEIWQSFLEEVKENPILRPVTLQSWNRCLSINLDPYKLVYDFLDPTELEQKREENQELIDASRPYLELLSSSMAGTPHVIVLSDQEGWIIDLIGIEELITKENGIILGSCWSEKHFGNNGIGTALALGEPVLVCGVEHISPTYKGWTCLGVPIKKHNKTIGALDISVPNKYGHPARLILGITCVGLIEKTLALTSDSQKRYGHTQKTLAIQNLVGTLVHDLKNPISIIKSLSDLGIIFSNNDKEKDLFSKINTQTDRVTEMVNELLGEFKDEPHVQLSLNSILQGLIQELNPMFNVANIKLNYYYNCDVICFVQVHLFKRAITNLCQNAVQAMGDNGNLTLGFMAIEDRVIISIEDTGEGIPKELEDTLFEPFVTGRPDGTGIGLFMAHQCITKKHNGRIWFEPNNPKGTIFRIDIPIVNQIPQCNNVS